MYFDVWFTLHVNILVCAYARSQVVRLSIEGDVVHVHVDVWVVLTADPADGRAVEGGPRADVGLQAGQGVRLLCGNVELWEFESQQLGRLVVAAIWQRRPAEKRGSTRQLRRDKVTPGRASPVVKFCYRSVRNTNMLNIPNSFPG